MNSEKARKTTAIYGIVFFAVCAITFAFLSIISIYVIFLSIFSLINLGFSIVVLAVKKKIPNIIFTAFTIFGYTFSILLGSYIIVHSILTVAPDIGVFMIFIGLFFIIVVAIPITFNIIYYVYLAKENKNTEKIEKIDEKDNECL